MRNAVILDTQARHLVEEVIWPRRWASLRRGAVPWAATASVATCWSAWMGRMWARWTVATGAGSSLRS